METQSTYMNLPIMKHFNESDISNKVDKFRKGETLKQWKEYEFEDYYDVFECTITVSSGFYVRQFVKDMSDSLGVKMIVTDIERTLIF